MSYLIPAILTLIVGYVLWQIKRERISLSYDVTESDSFPRDKGIGKYFVIKIRNSGNKAIQDIAVNIEFDSDVIETTSVSQEKLISNINRTNSHFTGEISLLNPKEVLNITITAQSNDHIGSPKVVARAPGATAIALDDSSNIQTYTQTLTLAVATAVLVYTGYTAINIFTKPIPKAVERIESIKGDLDKITQNLNKSVTRADKLDEIVKQREQGAPDTQQIVFSIFNRSGIPFLFYDLVDSQGEVTYWRTGTFLMHRFLKDKKMRDKYVGAMQLLVDEDRVSASSLGFNLYLLAKMEEHRGNTSKAFEYLSKCKEKAPLMYEYLMAQDPSYDTKAIELYLKNSSNPG